MRPIDGGATRNNRSMRVPPTSSQQDSTLSDSSGRNSLQANAAAAAHRAFAVIPFPAKLQNPKATRRRKGKSEGYYLARQREKEDQKLRETPNIYYRPELRSHVSAPILVSLNHAASPARRFVGCLVKPQDDLDDQDTLPIATTWTPERRPIRPGLQSRLAAHQSLPSMERSCSKHEDFSPQARGRVSYDDPLAGFSAFFRGTETAEATRDLSRFVHPRPVTSTLQEIKIHHNEPSYVSGFVNTPSSIPQRDFSQQLLRQSQSSATLGFGHTARSISKSFRKKFRRSSSRCLPESSNLPAQHVSAVHKHFGSDKSYCHETDDTRQDQLWSGFDESVACDDIPPLPPVHTASIKPVHASHRPGIDLDSNRPKSRVSSWTESEDCRTLEAPSIVLESIEESIESPRALSGCVHASKSDQKALQSSLRSLEIPSRIGSLKKKAFQAVDSQRVYSALMRRMSVRGRHKSDPIRQDDTIPPTDEVGQEDCMEHDRHAHVGPRNRTTVRMITPDQEDCTGEPIVEERVTHVHFNPRNLMSPSIYSERAISITSTTVHREPASLRRQPSDDSGVAIIHGSHSAARWNLTSDDPFDATSEERPEQVLKTSAEWRTWASSQIEGLDYVPPEFVRRDVGMPEDNHKGHHREEAQIDPSDTRIRPSRAYNRILSALSLRPSPVTAGSPSAHEEALVLANPWQCHTSRDSSAQSHKVTRTYSSEGKMEARETNAEQYAQTSMQPSEVHKRQSYSVIGANSVRSSDSVHGDSDTERVESQTFLRNARTMPDLSMAPVPASPMSDSFFRRIRRGPYESKTPSPSSQLPRAVQWRQEALDRRADAAPSTETVPLNKRESMVDQFLKSRSNADMRSPSNVDLLCPRKKPSSPFVSSLAAFL